MGLPNRKTVKWLLALLSWFLVPVVLVAMAGGPPTVVQHESTVKNIGRMAALLYVAMGAWILKKEIDGQTSKEGWRVYFAAAIWLYGAVACATAAVSSVHVATWINGGESGVVTRRSLLVGYYTVAYRGHRGTHQRTTYARVPDRSNPFIGADVPRLLVPPYSEGVDHYCMTEHVGRLGWSWYEDIGPCDTSPEYFATKKLARQRVPAQAFAEQGGDLSAKPTAIPLFTTVIFGVTGVKDARTGELAVTRESRPSAADDARVGVDLITLGQQLPLVEATKRGAAAVAWNQHYVLVKQGWILLLYGRQQNSWTWLKPPDDVPIDRYGKSVWVFGRDGHSLYEYERVLFEPPAFYRWDMIDP